MTMLAPASIAMRAAIIFVAMPPEPMSDPAAPAIASISGVIARNLGNEPRVRRRGADRRRKARRCRRAAQGSRPRSCPSTRAASRSLSPKRISAVATVSFSLITGTLPSASSVFNVERAFR